MKVLCGVAGRAVSQASGKVSAGVKTIGARRPLIDIRKVLASAVANAITNDGQDADELFVIACFADEGPTLRRFRPRARGRATRINKRTCHITVIVARMSDDRIAIVQARQERHEPGAPPRPPAGHLGELVEGGRPAPLGVHPFASSSER